jgi:hypothetical protein
MAPFQRSVSRGCGALTARMLILAGSIGTSIDALQSLNNVIAQQSNRSIIMPPSIVVPAMPIKGIIDPARVRTVWRSPKRVSPHGTDHAADDCSRRPGDDKSSSGAKGCADCVRSRTCWRSRHQRDGRACQERRLAQECPNRKTRHSSHRWKNFRHRRPSLVLSCLVLGLPPARHVESSVAQCGEFQLILTLVRRFQSCCCRAATSMSAISLCRGTWTTRTIVRYVNLPDRGGGALRAQIGSNPNCRIGIESSTPPASSFTSK